MNTTNNEILKELKELRGEVKELRKAENEGPNVPYFVGNHSDASQSKEYLKEKRERQERTGGGRFAESYR